jgi:Metallo-peptidase family M12B Reprolysin-like
MGNFLRCAAAMLVFIAIAGEALGEPNERSWLTLVAKPHTNFAATTAQSSVNVDVAALFTHGHGEVRSIPVNAEKNLSLKGLRVLSGDAGARTWVGKHREDESEHNVFITERDGFVYGIFYAADTVYELSGDTKAGTIRLLDQRAAGYTLAPPTAQDYIDPPLPPRALTQAHKLANEPVVFATPAPQSVIDLLVVYSDGMVTRYGSEAGALARINNLVAQANTAYLNSEVAITLRLVATYRTSYSETTSNLVALDAITPSIPSFNRSVITPPALAAVAALRDSSQADMVMLIRPFRRNAHQSCGMANRNGTVGFDIAVYEGWAYSVFSDGLDLEAGNGTCPDTAFSHEIGHVMGMNHDRGSIAVEQPSAYVPVVSFGHGFGYGYNAPGCIPFGSPGATCQMPTHGDIMSIAYVNRNLACYSNPQARISSNGLACGLNLASGTIAGVAPDTPEESCIGSAAGCGAAAASCAGSPTCAHATRGLNYVRVKVSRWRDAAVSGTIQQNGAGVANLSICTSNPEILCTASNGNYRCSGPAGWIGSIHPRATGYRIPAVKIPNALATNTSFNLNAQLDSTFPTCNLDVDGNGLVEPASDGVAMLRRFMGFDTTSFGALAGVCAQNATAASLYAASEKAAVAVTGAPSSSATSDGLVLLRAMRGLTGNAVTQGAIPNGAARSQWSLPAGANNNIREWLNANCGTAFGP